MTIKIDGKLHTILEFQHVKLGRSGAFIRTRLKSLSNGTIIDKTFRAGEKVQEAFIEEKRLLFSYRTGDTCHFLDQITYENIVITEDVIGEAKSYLKENSEITATLCDGRIVGVILPNFVELTVSYTEPGFRGDTAHGGSKPARLETGASIEVPLFVNPGDTVRIDTRSGEYAGRAK